MDSLDRNGWFSSGDGRQLGRVCGNKTLFDDHAKVFHSGGVKRTLEILRDRPCSLRC